MFLINSTSVFLAKLQPKSMSYTPKGIKTGGNLQCKMHNTLRFLNNIQHSKLYIFCCKCVYSEYLLVHDMDGGYQDREIIITTIMSFCVENVPQD